MIGKINSAMVMAAGMGTRMMPLTADKPKPLVKVGGVTLLDHVLDHLRAAGIAQVVINIHRFPEQIEAHMAEHARDLNIIISDERDVLRDTGGGLVKAKSLIHSDPFYCINADNWWSDGTENALARLAAHWDDDRMDALMLMTDFARAHNTQGQGDFEMDGDGLLSRRKLDQSAPYVWTGIQIISKRLIVDPPSDVFSTNVFWDRAISQGRCFGLIHDGLWFDVGYPAAVTATENYLEVHG